MLLLHTNKKQTNTIMRRREEEADNYEENDYSKTQRGKITSHT
jgi:hypothetical protein